VAPGRGGQTQAMTVFPATYSLPTNVTKTAAKGALVSRHMLKVEPGEHMKTGQVCGLAPRLQLEERGLLRLHASAPQHDVGVGQ
jgi:hypothetical protein